MATIEITKDNFEATLEKGGTLLLDFWATWCGPCRNFGPVYESVSEENPDIVFGKVNTEEQPELAGAFSIESIPTIMVFRDRILLFAQAGALPRAALEDVVEQVKKLDMDDVRRQIDEEEKRAAG